MNICFVTNELADMPPSGGIGTATLYLAKALREKGHTVSILFTAWRSEGLRSSLINMYKVKHGLTLYMLAHEHLDAYQPFQARIPKIVYDFFQSNQERFDAVLFHEYLAVGYYVIKCRAFIPSLRDAALGVITHSSSQWCNEANNLAIQSLDNLAIIEMERETVQMADYIISPSQYLMDWMASKKWQLPEKRFVIQNVIGEVKPREVPEEQVLQKNKINELIFFGRLEVRKGVQEFITCLEHIPFSLMPSKITFLGGACDENAESLQYKVGWLRERGIKTKVITDQDSASARKYLRRSRGLVVMPSLADNSPSVILECIEDQVPFICSNSGGQAELIHPDDAEYCLCDPRARPLAEAIVRVLSAEQVVIPRNSYTPSQAVEYYEQTLAQVVEEAQKRVTNVEVDKTPLVSVVIPTFNRSQMLLVAIDSVLKQTYENVEIVVVNDGSTDARALEVLEQLPTLYQGLRVVNQPNKYLGAARNNGARHANGEYIVFLDDDNYLVPEFIDRLMECIQKDNADCVTTGMRYFASQDQAPSVTDLQNNCFFFYGGNDWAISILRNTFGDATGLYKRDMVLDVKFEERYKATYEDWAFYLNATKKGYRVATVPEPLMYYRYVQKFPDVEQCDVET